MTILCQLMLFGLALGLTADTSPLEQTGIGIPGKTHLENELDQRGTEEAKHEIPAPHSSQEQNDDRNLVLFEGDIKLTSEQKQDIDDAIKEDMNGVQLGTRQKRKYLKTAKLWPRGIVYYEPLSMGPFRYNQAYMKPIFAAMQHIERQTCIRFKQRTKGTRIRFVYGNGCFSWFGMQPKRRGVQPLILGPRCNYMGVVVHELLHALGFLHEQSRPDRDKYVIIYWENIQRGQAYNFKKYNVGQASTLGLPYDLGSIMHYGATEFSIGKRYRSIMPKNRIFLPIIGQRYGLSAYDGIAIRKLYRCQSRD